MAREEYDMSLSCSEYAGKISFFEYGEKETEYLRERDAVLRRYIDIIGHVYRRTDSDVFSSLIFNIAGQQISSKAFETVRARMRSELCEVTPQEVLRAGEENLRKCGLSGKKASWIMDVAKKTYSGELDIAPLGQMSDDQVLKMLTALSGVGRWTAEMVMLFCLCRMDILSTSDYGIKAGITAAYGLKNPSYEDFRYLKSLYSPYGSVASLYLWEIASGKYGILSEEDARCDED